MLFDRIIGVVMVSIILFYASDHGASWLTKRSFR